MPPPLLSPLPRRTFDAAQASDEFSKQWANPGDIFSVLLLLGGDVVNRALAQLAGTRVSPVAFSFGWVAYAMSAVASAVGENRLMPPPDCACKVINAETGHIRENSSWIIGRIVRDFGSWRHEDVDACVDKLLDLKWEQLRQKAERERPGSGQHVGRPAQSGLCVSVYKAGDARPRHPGYDLVYLSGILTVFLQLGVAAIPCGLFGDWSILLITICGIVLSFAMGYPSQWAKEKWACRTRSKKVVILTRGSGSQHVIIIIGDGRGLDLEDLATGPINVDVSTSAFTRLFVIVLAIIWVLLLITAAGVHENTWFLLAVGGIGILQNIFVAARWRDPAAFGAPLIFDCVFGETSVMQTLYLMEERYPKSGRNMLETFFPGGMERLSPEERKKWAELEAAAHSTLHIKNVPKTRTT
ncbi:hypothetical protein N7462_000334 [Penicillium macrosclerotiorum]|uniref:uncharacterized protein n=1 Tax=Penicillium macrosclerotiorum TaxID=303699 RepID=UPI0025465B6F|nr:uncharacterized protein N7462_000334 [Penicillium macrosclerotiorum]KAJ5698329.1 hypothetical protein N7462_000334 [Penicillium macrosclerotiorum]